MKDFNLRPYQVDALNVIHEDLQTEQVVLLQAVMGAGKTVTLCRLINRYWHETDRRFLVLAHKKELVQQFLDCFKNMTGVPIGEIGICCAGLGEKILGKRLTIGTIQTFVNLIDNYPGCDLLVVDEAHRISIGTGSQYDQVIDGLKQKQENMRIIGCTATVGRLGHGFIYGEKCRPGAFNLFPRLNHQIKYSTLLEQGYLVELRGKVAHAESLATDLENVKVNGDYVLDQLGEVMSREIHLRTAVQAIREHCSDYDMICVFCCTIAHAERLKELLGDECTIIHSQLSPLEREINMQDWTTGRKRICTSINILSEGVDIPPLQCLVMARPTLSSTLYLQSVGRVLRLHDGKDHGFILDLTDNTSRFGSDLDNVKVGIPKAVVKDILDADPLIKLCPNCEREVFISLRQCPFCEYEWPAAEIIEANHVPELTDIKFQKQEKKPDVWHDVIGMTVQAHESRKSGKWLGRILFDYGSGMYPAEVSLWLCLPDFYEGYAVQKSKQKWDELCGWLPFPKTVEEFEESGSTLVTPKRICLDENGKYAEIKGFEFDEVPWDQDDLVDDVIEIFDGEALPF